MLLPAVGPISERTSTLLCHEPEDQRGESDSSLWCRRSTREQRLSSFCDLGGETLIALTQGLIRHRICVSPFSSSPVTLPPWLCSAKASAAQLISQQFLNSPN